MRLRPRGITRSVVVGWATQPPSRSTSSPGSRAGRRPALRAEAERRVVALEIEPSATAWTLAVATAAPGRSRVVDAFLDLVDEHGSTGSGSCSAVDGRSGGPLDDEVAEVGLDPASVMSARSWRPGRGRRDHMSRRQTGLHDVGAARWSGGGSGRPARRLLEVVHCSHNPARWGPGSHRRRRGDDVVVVADRGIAPHGATGPVAQVRKVASPAGKSRATESIATNAPVEGSRRAGAGLRGRPLAAGGPGRRRSARTPGRSPAPIPGRCRR